MKYIDLTVLPQELSIEGGIDLSNYTALTSLPVNLSVRGNLGLSGCTALTSLPANLSVGDNLYLRGCTALNSLPMNLGVGGNLYFRGCTALTSLPANLGVGGDLYLRGCTALTSLPANLSVWGVLDLYDCTALTSLPANLSIGGNLNLIGCTALTSLPANLSVGGNLDFSICTALTSLPVNLSVGGNLGLSHCTALTSLPVNLSVNGYLYLFGCTALTALPADLNVGGTLYLAGCTALISLPADLNVGDALYLARCTALTSLPANLSVGDSLDLDGCTALTSLSANLSVGGSLDLFGCTALTSLPANLSVGGSLDLFGCTALTSLPANLSVGGFLDLFGCTALTSLPANLSVGGSLDLRGCTALTSLPETILSWGPGTDGLSRTINISGTGLSQSIRDHLHLQPNPNLRFIYNEVSGGAPRGNFETLHEALDHLKELSQAQTLLAWPADQQAVLCQYLDRVVETADYKNINVRSALLERLDAVLTLACTDLAFRAYALNVLDDAVQSCGDRVVLELNTVEREMSLKLVSSKPAIEQASVLKELGLSLMKLSIVQAHAAQSCQHMQFVDEVEVYLAYETKLRERLGLPGKTVFMLFKSYVRDEDFEAAALDAERQSSDPAVVEAFFATWTPWQQHLRRTQEEASSFMQVRTQTGLPPTPMDEPRLCAITQEPETALKQPVYLGAANQARVYEYADLIKWWVEHGKEPAPFGAFTLDQLWRAAE